LGTIFVFRDGRPGNLSHWHLQRAVHTNSDGAASGKMSSPIVAGAARGAMQSLLEVFNGFSI
jgi:hypothetical protein